VALQLEKRHEGDPILQRLYSTFPSGPPGVGLLLLRATVGIILIAQGVTVLDIGKDLTLSGLSLGVVAFASGVSILIGFLTPIASLVAVVVSATVALSLFPQHTLDLVQPPPAAALLGVIVLALAFLGPGAFSVDSRLFGRREIVIPQVSRAPKS